MTLLGSGGTIKNSFPDTQESSFFHIKMYKFTFYFWGAAESFIISIWAQAWERVAGWLGGA